MSNTFKPLPGLLDRLDAALKAQGVELKRTQLLAAAAGAFGYRNSNTLTAAHKAGEINPPPANLLGTVTLPGGERIVLLTDAIANAPYGIDASFLEQVACEERREEIGITPYGHLAWLGPILDTPLDEKPADVISDPSPKPLQVHAAIIQHRHGNNHYAALSEDELYRQLAEYVREEWREVERYAAKGDDPEEMEDQKVVHLYFELCERHGIEEYIEYITEAVQVPTGWSSNSEKPPQPADHASLLRLADDLDEGAQADIWYDATEHGDEPAESSIETTQNAMAKAAEVLRSLARSSLPDTRQGGDVAPSKDMAIEDEACIWLTDDEGDPTFDGRASEALFDRLGLSYSTDDGEFLPLTDAEFAVVRDRMSFGSRYKDGWSFKTGFSALYRGKKFHAVEIEFMWGPEFGGTNREDALEALQALRARIEQSVEALEGHVIIDIDATDCTHEMQVLLPFKYAEWAGSIEDYFRAVDYLINGTDEPEQKQVIAEFRPQAWVRDHAVEVDPEGERKFNVTFDLLLMGFEKAMNLENDGYDRDELRYAHTAPKWVRDWSGPFEVDVSSFDIEDLFKIIR